MYEDVRYPSWIFAPNVIARGRGDVQFVALALPPSGRHHIAAVDLDYRDIGRTHKQVEFLSFDVIYFGSVV